jgi:hypothetical protein
MLIIARNICLVALLIASSGCYFAAGTSVTRDGGYHRKATATKPEVKTDKHTSFYVKAGVTLLEW